MRRGVEPSVLTIDGKFVGFNLSADYCAEHEWGIKRIDATWQRDQETHRLKTTPEAVKKLRFAVSSDGEHALLYFRDCIYGEFKFPMSGCKKNELLKYHNELRLLSLPSYRAPTEKEIETSKIASAWDEDEFALLVNGKELVEQLWLVHDALVSGDAAIWLGGGGAFKNAGFCLAIYSKLPEEVIKNWRDHYEDMRKLNAASEATGIEGKLKNANKSWFALTPKWISGFKDQTSKHPVIYWLNPVDQDKHNFGWYTVEQLELWAEDKGPIPMTKEQMAKRHSR